MTQEEIRCRIVFRQLFQKVITEEEAIKWITEDILRAELTMLLKVSGENILVDGDLIPIAEYKTYLKKEIANISAPPASK